MRDNTGAKEGAWQRVVATIDRARQDGLEVLADTTPFLDGSGQAQGILPPWLLSEGTAKAAEAAEGPGGACQGAKPTATATGGSSIAATGTG